MRLTFKVETDTVTSLWWCGQQIGLVTKTAAGTFRATATKGNVTPVERTSMYDAAVELARRTGSTPFSIDRTDGDVT